MYTIIGVGELLWDVFDDGRVLGGAPANFAYHVHCLRCTGLTFSRIGHDQAGEDILAALDAVGLCTGFIQRDEKHPTGKVNVELNREGMPRFDILDDVAWDYMHTERRWLDAARGADAVCFGTLSQRNPCSRETLYQVLDTAENAVRVLDLNLRGNLFSENIICESLTRANVLKLNVYELATIREMLGYSHDDATLAREMMQDHDLELICITHGEEGCAIYTHDNSVQDPAPTTSICDTVGAGDAFCAGLTIKYLNGDDLQSIAHGANILGAYVAGCRGAMPDMPEDIIDEFHTI